MHRYLGLFAIYVIVYLPVAAVVAVVEGAARGDWGLRPHDWAYQLGAFVAFLGAWLLLAGPLIAGVLQWLLGRIHRARSKHAILFAGLAGVIAVVLGATVVAEAVALVGQGGAVMPVMLLLSPVAFIGGAAVYGIVCYRLVSFALDETAAP